MAGFTKRKLTSGKLDVIKLMPPLYHKLPEQEFEIRKSETIDWLINQPEILAYLWDEVARKSENVIYDKNTGKWQGVDYEQNKTDILRDVPYHVGEYNKPKPSCYDPCDKYNGRYTKCRGESTPNGFAENDCSTCCWLQTYHDLVGDDPYEY